MAILLRPMATKREILKVSERAVFGSRATRRMRRGGEVPGVVYSGGGEARAFQVNGRELRAFLVNGSALFDLEVEGSSAVPVVVKDRQRHPVRGEITHIDFYEVRLDEPIQADVSIELLGAEDSPGAKNGGVFEHVTRQVTITALPTDIPEILSLDVSTLEIGETASLATLPLPDGVGLTVDNPDEITIVTVSAPRISSADDAEAEQGAADGEAAADAAGDSAGDNQVAGDEGE